MWYCVMYALPSLSGEEISSHAHETGSQYLLEVFSKIWDEHPRPLCTGVSRGEGPRCYTHFAAAYLVQWPIVTQSTLAGLLPNVNKVKYLHN